MSDSQATAAGFFRRVAETLEHADTLPYGPSYTSQNAKLAGQALVAFCDGDQDKGRTLWKIICADLGYMPDCVARALIRCANTTNLVPDVEAPDPT